MKKFLALILTLALVMSMSTVAFAEDFVGNGEWNEETLGDKSTNNVQVTVNNGGDAIVYRIVITWEPLAFTYDFGSGAVWNPETHEYDLPNDADGWGGNNTADITIKNHSNADVNFSTAFNYDNTPAVSATEKGVTAALASAGATEENGKLSSTIESADADAYRDMNGDGVVDGTPTATITVTVSGTPTVTTGNIAVGTITVTISAVPAQQPQP